MVAQILYRGDGGTQRRSYPLILFLFVLVFGLNFSCGSKPTELRSLAPADSLIYLETNDLGAALQPIIESKGFGEAARSRPDLSVIKGVQIAIAVTGFETSEQKLNDENSVLNFTPHFVAIADTHAWQWQTNSFAENHLGEFVNKIYGGGVQLETSGKDGGTQYVWTAEDGRKSYALVVGSLIFFGNDPSSIERVQAVRRGEADSIGKSGKLQPADASALAFGHVSQEGIAQIANFIGAAKAKETGEEAEVQSFVARVLPQLLRGAITEATWTARKTEEGIEDKLELKLNPEIASVLNETLAPSDSIDNGLLDFAPADSESVTQYNLKNPQIGWRSVVLASQKLIDPVSGNLIAAFSNSFFEPYGIKDGEMFLGSISNAVTVRYEDDDDVAVIARVRDPKGRTNSLDAEDLKTEGTNIQINEPGFENVALNGSAEVVAKCIGSHQNGQNQREGAVSSSGQNSMPSTRTMGIDRDTAKLIAGVMSEKRSDETTIVSRYVVETRFNKAGLERRLVSEFGLISSIIAMLAADE